MNTIGRDDAGVAEIELGLLLDGLIVLQRRIGLGELRLQHIDLLLSRLYGGSFVLKRSACSVEPRDRLLRQFLAAGAAFGESRVTIVLLLCIGEVGSVKSDRIVRLHNNALLLV